ncbi:MAG: DUF1778 domain-containing protein [Armatimonadetes bacterium]|nr:DUF1778 domain-containing protein [Armatimonadota bacterium]
MWHKVHIVPKVKKSKAPAPSEVIQVRVTAAFKRKVQKAAKAQKKTVKDFVIDAVGPAAEAMVQGADGLDQTVFTLDAAAWEKFNELLEAPERDMPGLRRLLTKPPAWESP